MSYVKLTKQLKAFLVFYLFHVPLFSLISSLCPCLWPRKLTCIISSTELCTSEFQLGSHNGKPHREIVGRREMRLEYLFPWLSSSEVALGFWLQFLTQISWSIQEKWPGGREEEMTVQILSSWQTGCKDRAILSHTESLEFLFLLTICVRVYGTVSFAKITITCQLNSPCGFLNVELKTSFTRLIRKYLYTS